MVSLCVWITLTAQGMGFLSQPPELMHFGLKSLCSWSLRTLTPLYLPDPPPQHTCPHPYATTQL